jgi:ABC-type branched-subunit amino acid transport system substrate-binding protein
MAMNYFKNILLCCFLIAAVASAQMVSDSITFRPDVERQFVEGMKFFKAGNYDSAAGTFNQLLKEHPRSHRATGASIMAAKAFYHTKNYRESIRLLKDLIDLYPQSTYIDDAHYTLGLDYYELTRYEDAASEFTAACDTASDAVVKTRSESFLNTLAIEKLSTSELYLLRSGAKSDLTKALINLHLAEKLNRANDIVAAQEALRIVAALPPSTPYVGDALNLLEQLTSNSEIKIGALLPLMTKDEQSPVHAMGLEFYEGMQLAVDEYNQTASIKIKFDARDTEKDPSTAAKQVSDLCNDPTVVAVLGPILSNEALACAGIANERGVPLITPTATANGIAAMGPYIFQANPDFDVRGRAPAAYAFDHMNAKRFAVLAPSDAVGKQMADAFIAEVQQLGGELVDAQWYTAGTMDLRIQLTALRRRSMEASQVPTIDFGGKVRQSELNKLTRWGVDQHILDSLMQRGLTAPVTLLFGKNGKHIADSLQIPLKAEILKYDSLYLPAQGIDAIFIPITSSDEIAIVSSQLKYYNIDAQVLGTSDWNEPGELDKNHQYTDGVIFFVDSYTNMVDEGYRTFVAKYQQTHPNRTPGQNVFFGYDAAVMLLNAMSKTNMHRTDIAAALSKVQEFRGLHCQYTFTRQRVNSHLTALQFKGRQILRIGEEDISLDKK